MNRLEKIAGLVLALILIAAAVNMLPGCVSLEAPSSFNQRMAYAYASLAASRSTAASMLERGRITKDQAKEAQTIADNVRSLLDGARATLNGGDVKTAEGQLQMALDVLVALETRLKQMEAK